jgi:hypothetical protein
VRARGRRRDRGRGCPRGHRCGRCCASPRWWSGTWLAARAEAPDLTEAETREALERLDPLWDELFPAEQARIVRLLVERVEVGPAGADIRLRVAGLASLVRDLGAGRRRDASGGVSEAASITVRVPLAIRRRPGRKTVVTPAGSGAAAVRRAPTRRW